MHLQLDEQFIVDEQGSKKAVIIPFNNYLKLLDAIKQHNEPEMASNFQNSIWQTHKGHSQTVKAWLVSDGHRNFPAGNAKKIEQTVQEIRDAWGDE